MVSQENAAPLNRFQCFVQNSAIADIVSPSRQRASVRWALITIWVLTLATFPVWVGFEHPGWDVDIYHNAARSLSAGHDPYADAIAVQKAFHDTLALHPNSQVPYSYVYSPITLPVVSVANVVPAWLIGSLYWCVYALGVLSLLWVGWQAVEPRERNVFRFIVPLGAFFPGLLASDNVLSGNVAYILYGAMLVAAVVGWRRRRWSWFYAATLIASCFKAPLLSLLAIPVLSERRQWSRAAAAAVAGVALFGVQGLVAPNLFHHYLEAVGLQFSYNRDFGSSPAGLFSGFLFDHNVAYSLWSTIFFLAYAVPLFACLVYLSRRFFRGEFSLRQWIPVMLTGVILLNPRLMEYDLAPIAVPLALLGWRAFASRWSTRHAITLFGVAFLAVNCIAYRSWLVWKMTEGPLLVILFVLGAVGLARQSRAEERFAEYAVAGGSSYTSHPEKRTHPTGTPQ